MPVRCEAGRRLVTIAAMRDPDFGDLHLFARVAEPGTLSRGRQVLATLDEMEGEFATKAREVSGLVRVAASTVLQGLGIGRLATPVVGDELVRQKRLMPVLPAAKRA